MLSTSSLNGKLETLYIKDIITLVSNTEVVWDDVAVNNRIFQKLALIRYNLGIESINFRTDIQLVQTMLSDNKYNLNIQSLPFAFYEQLTTKKKRHILFCLLNNNYITEYMNDLFLYVANKKLSLVKKLLPKINSMLIVEQALILNIYIDNLDNFTYIWENYHNKTAFKTDFIAICLKKHSLKILNYLFKTEDKDKIQQLFNLFFFNTLNNFSFDIFLLFLSHNVSIPEFSQEYINELCGSYGNFMLFHYLLKKKLIIPTSDLLEKFSKSSVYNMSLNFIDGDYTFINDKEKIILDEIYQLLLNY